MAERGSTQLTPTPTAAAADYPVGSEKWVVMTHTDVVLVCLICGFLVMGCVVIYFHQCADRLLAREFGGERIVRWRPGAVARGLDSEVIDAFPRFRYSDVKALMIGNGALECAVCLNEFDGEENLRLLPRCCHVFHTHCIDEWLAAYVTCPVCRAILIPGSPGEFYMDSVPSHHDPVEEIVEINSASRERIAGKLPRSHSTGHSLIQPGGHCDRFRLRLPEEVMNRVVTTGLPGEMSSRKGYRSIRPTAILFSSGVPSRWSKEESSGDAGDLSTIPRISPTEKDDGSAERSINELRPYSPVMSGPL